MAEYKSGQQPSLTGESAFVPLNRGVVGPRSKSMIRRLGRLAHDLNATLLADSDLHRSLIPARNALRNEYALANQRLAYLDQRRVGTADAERAATANRIAAIDEDLRRLDSEIGELEATIRQKGEEWNAAGSFFNRLLNSFPGAREVDHESRLDFSRAAVPPRSLERGVREWL